MITVITGIRDIAADSYDIVEMAVLEELARPNLHEIRFGGARGVDDVALRAAFG